MDDETIRNGTAYGAVNGHGPEERAEAVAPLAPIPQPPAPVPPMEAEWLRAVGGRPENGRANGAAARSWNGRPGTGVDSTRGGH